MKEKNLLFKRAMLALCLLAVCWVPAKADVMLGDVDSDGEVSIADVAKLIDYLLTDDVSMVNIGNADVNQDGQVDIADVASLIDVLLLMPANPQQEHEWVDLGLPSGTLWATCNVGASAPEEYGYYFAWGETEPKDYYAWSTYKWCKGGDFCDLTKYCTESIFGYNDFVDNKMELDSEDDAAYVNWGPSWRMPTQEQQDELIEKCTWQRATQNGFWVTGPNGNTLFLPVAGSRWNDSLNSGGTYGYYWSRTLGSGHPTSACFLYISPGTVHWSSYIRREGLTVRPVRVP